MSSNDDPLIAEAIATLSDAVTQSRADVVHAVVTTAADSKGKSTKNRRLPRNASISRRRIDDGSESHSRPRELG